MLARTCAGCQQHYRQIRFAQIDVAPDNTDHVPSSSVQAPTPVVNRAVAWR